jgi:hypothetical protein
MKTLSLLLGLVFVVAAPQNPGKAKHKHKSFQPVVLADIHGYIGRYTGIDSMYGVDVRIGSDDRLAVTVHQGSTSTLLRDAHIEGAKLTGLLEPNDGKAGPFQATFGRRDVNGRRAFGLITDHSVRISGDVGIERLFCARH